MWTGLLDLGFWGKFIALMVLTQLTIMSVTLYLHRGQAHRAIDYHPAVSHFFRFWLWLTTGMVTRQWSAVHRKHHAKCETKEDPHSPLNEGIWRVLFKGLLLYRNAVRDEATIEKYGHGAPNDWIERKVYTPLHSLGIYVMLAVDLALFGWAGFIMWLIQLVWIPLFAAGVINGVGHYWGYRNFESPDASRNILPWGLFIGGEELHNNHHAFGTSAKFSVRKWEIDIGWGVVTLLSWLKLAKVKRALPKLHRDAAKSTIDVDTVMAVINNRFQLMRAYTRKVMKPTIKLESKKMGARRRLFAKKAALLWRDQRFFKQSDFEQLKQMLASSQQLKIVHQYHQQLKEIWSRTHASKDELISQLQDWCIRAEKTGIKALEDFATTIKSYSVREAQAC